MSQVKFATLDSRMTHWNRVRATNGTGTIVPTVEGTTKPSTSIAGNIEVPTIGGTTPTHARLMLFGEGADDTVMQTRVYAINEVTRASGSSLSYFYTLLVDATFTLGTKFRAGSSTDRVADTVSVTGGLVSDTKLVSPADGSAAWILFDIMGAKWLNVQGSDGTGTNFNHLIAWL